MLGRAFLIVVACAAPAMADRNLEARLGWFELGDGRFVEGAFCGTADDVVSRYGCLAYAVGRQDGHTIASDAFEAGVRIQPAPSVWFTAGGGASVLGGLVDVIVCGAGKSRRGSEGSSMESSSCPKTLLPLGAYLGASANVALPIADVRLVLSGVARHQVEHPSNVIAAHAPAGGTLSIGLGVQW